MILSTIGEILITTATYSVAAVSFLGLLLFIVDKFLLAAPKYDGGESDHFDGKKFVNPDGAGTHRYIEVLKWWFGGNDKGMWHLLNEDDVPPSVLSAREVEKDEFRITFVNHATFLLQFNGCNILTDPIWSNRASPYQWIGPKRMRPPGIKFENLPPIDTVLISHNHYDHLDIPTIEKLHRQHNPLFIVPLGVEHLLREHGIAKVVNMDWWDQKTVKSAFTVTAVPARHFSCRGLFDRNKTLWCGYVIESPAGVVYFAGDTGYGKFVKEIGKKFPSIQASLIPIGAYRPRWFMAPIHLSPEEAIQVHRDLQSEVSIAMHFGTFPLADDGMREGAQVLQQKMAENQMAADEFLVLQEGTTKTIKQQLVY